MPMLIDLITMIIPMAGGKLTDQLNDQSDALWGSFKLLATLAISGFLVYRSFKSGFALGAILVGALTAAVLFMLAFSGGLDALAAALKAQFGW